MSDRPYLNRAALTAQSHEIPSAAPPPTVAVEHAAVVMERVRILTKR
jgi:hypothetical protein